MREEGKTFDGLSLLSCDTLGDLDNGFARIVIDEALKRAANDLDQRGDDEKPRKVCITIELKQLAKGDIAVKFAADAKLPPLTLQPTIAQTRPQGTGNYKLAFRADNAARPDQPTIPYEETE
jgi:hypothetical protein